MKKDKKNINKKQEIKVVWNKQNGDVTITWPLGVGTYSDAYLMNSIFNEFILNEFDRRDYDLSTIKFSISPKKKSDRFSSTRKKRKSGFQGVN